MARTPMTEEQKAAFKERMAKARADKKAKAGEQGAEAPTGEETHAPIVNAGEVKIETADNRVLQAAIGDRVFEGKVIYVPEEQADDVRRLLKEGGFFIKE